MQRVPGGLVLVLVAALVSAAGCTQHDGDASDTQITVYAASSLTAGFSAIAEAFEAEHPDVAVRLNFGGSSDLATQISEGAPADVFASADLASMDRVGAEQAERPRPFATNTLQIAVPPGNPADIGALADLADPDLNLVVCAPQVPCGAATRTASEAAGVPLRPVSEEQSVADVLAKVVAGEADAGLVYVTDVEAANGAVEGIEFAESSAAVNTYAVATLLESLDSRGGQAAASDFVDFVLGERGQRILEQTGFGAP